MKTLKIPQPTKKGYVEVEEGGCFDGSYLTSKTRRGRVQGGGGFVPRCAQKSRRYLSLNGLNNFAIFAETVNSI